MYLPIAPVTIKDQPHNSIHVSLDYEKGAGPLLRLQAGQRGADGVWSFVIFGSPSRRTQLESWPRANAKKLTALRQELLQQVRARAGRLWDEVVHFCDQHGFQLVSDAATVGSSAGN